MSAEVGQSPNNRPSIRVWIVAVIEIAAAIALARLMLSSTTAQSGVHDHAGMTHRSSPPGPGWSWAGTEAAYLAAVLVTGIWFLASRRRIAAVVTATTLTALISSAAVRAAAGGSHLVAMLVLETAMTAVPLLLVFAGGEHMRLLPAFGRSRALLVAAAAGYGAVIVAIHLPGLHEYVLGDEGLPIWLVAVAVLIAVVFWHEVLHGCQSARTRRRALIGAQEVAAFVGLLSLFSAWPSGHDSADALLSGPWDQRLGGIAMLSACALSTGLALRRIQDDVGVTQP